MGIFKSMNLRYAATTALCTTLLLMPYLVFYHSPEALRLFSQSAFSHHLNRILGSGDSQSSFLNETLTFTLEELDNLQRILDSASLPNRTVIITTLNKAWATGNSMLDLFLESFRVGEGTSPFLNNLVIITLDQVAYEKCISIHKHCFSLRTKGVDFSGDKFFMTNDYLKMMWRRIDLLRVVLELGYSFVFSDADIMWFRDPFPRLHKDSDFEIACDQYTGDPNDLRNQPNGGFVHVRSNNRTINFYKFWYKSRELYPGRHDQDVLNAIKLKTEFMAIGMKIRFLSTEFFGGFCQLSRDLDKVCTIHANCCTGLVRKINDLRLIITDWKRYKSLKHSEMLHERVYWRAPRDCLHSFGG